MHFFRDNCVSSVFESSCIAHTLSLSVRCFFALARKLLFLEALFKRYRYLCLGLMLCAINANAIPAGDQEAQSADLLAVSADNTQKDDTSKINASMPVASDADQATINSLSPSLNKSDDEARALGKETVVPHMHEIVNRHAWVTDNSGQTYFAAIRSPLFTDDRSCAAFVFSEDDLPLQSPFFCDFSSLNTIVNPQLNQGNVQLGGIGIQHGHGPYGKIDIASPSFPTTSRTALAWQHDSHGLNQLTLDTRDPHRLLQLQLNDDQGYQNDSGYQHHKIRLKAYQHGEQWALTHQVSFAHLDQTTVGYVEGQDAYKHASQQRVNPTPDAYRKSRALRIDSHYQRFTADGRTLSIRPFMRYYDNESTVEDLPAQPSQRRNHSSIGVQTAFEQPYSNKVWITTGFDAEYTQGRIKQTQTDDIADARYPVGEHYAFHASVLETAWYINHRVKLSPHWQLMVGGRLNWWHYDYDNSLSDGNACSSAITDCGYIRPSNDTRNIDDQSGQTTLIYQLSPLFSSHIKLSRAIRPPHTDELYRLSGGQTDATVNVEMVDAIEWGIHGSVQQTLDYRLTHYLAKNNNAIVRTADLHTVDGQKTKHRGVELTLDYTPLSWLAFKAASSYNKHQYDSNIQLENSDHGNIRGLIIDSSVRHKHYAHIDLLATPSSLIRFDVNYVGRYYLNPENTLYYPGHTLYNARFTQELFDSWSIEAAIINLSNEDYAYHADVTLPIITGQARQARYLIGESRQYRFSISKRF